MKSYNDLLRQWNRISNEISISSRRYDRANRAFTNYAINISKIGHGGSADKKYRRLEYMDLIINK